MRTQASILHLDLDAFFAAVEQRDKPSLRGKPVVVGGLGPRGVVSTASYEARAFGIRSAMSMSEARSRCPNAAFLTTRFPAYQAASRTVMSLLKDLSPLVEPLSLDEAFVDLTVPPTRDLTIDGVTQLAAELKATITATTGGLTGSAGLASSKLMAKIASELAKPDGLVVVPPGTETDVLGPLLVTVIPGVGPATTERLRRVGVHTVAELERISEPELVRLVGKAHGHALYLLARARDDRRVDPERESKSVSLEDTFDTDLVDPALLKAILERYASRVSERLRAHRLSGRTVTVKVRLHDFTTHTRSSTLRGPTDDARVIARLARSLVTDVDTSGGVRLLGVAVSGLADWIQDDLFSDSEEVGPIDDVTAAAEIDRRGLARRWLPGVDVEHASYGRGWVWGSGRGGITVRFETAETGAGAIHTLPIDDPDLRPASPAVRPARTEAPADMVRCVTEESMDAPETPSPPVAKRVPTERTHHGDTVVDDYEWLRDKDGDATAAHLKAENAYTESMTAGQGPLREAIFAEIKSRTEETDLSVPVRKHGWWYYSRTLEGSQYALHCRAPARSPDRTPPTLDARTPVLDEQIMLDGNTLAQGSDFFALGTVDVTSDGRLLAYSVDLTGDERFTIHVKDLESGALLTDEIPRAFYGSAWSLDGRTLFYTTVDEAWRPYRVWRHRIGTTAAEDDLVYEEADERFWLNIGVSRSERYIVLDIGSRLTSESRVLESNHPLEQFRVVVPRREGVEYGIEHAVIGGQDRFLILHNDASENFALAEAPVDDADPANWQEVIRHDPHVRLLGVDAFASHLVVSYRREGLTGLRILPLDDEGYGDRHEIAFDETLFSAAPGGNPEFDSPTFRYGYSSFVTPPSVFDYDIASRRSTLLKQTPVLGDFDPGAYEQHREWAVADDGARIPISVVVRKNVPRDGTAPALLYGYGAYEISVDPGFSISRLSLLDRGVVFAVAHVRGGGEMGRAWYEQGKMLHKTNTFTDFIACARRLVELGWTSVERLAAEGGSAGGLLMGAVANLAPADFAGILAEVPFVDALTTILDPSLPLTVVEWEEWGDPLHSAEVYEYMKSYSPYDQVAAIDYPPILAMTSLNDTRVLYVEPAKWVAKLRQVKSGDAPVLLKTELGAGHGGPSGRYDAWRDRAFALAWVIDVVGASPEPVA